MNTEDQSKGATSRPSANLDKNDHLLDPWQQTAVDELLSHHSVVIDAPTSAGKSRIFESWITQKMEQGGSFQFIYTAPTKSLANDKYHELAEKFGENHLGIATGDRKKNLHAPILIVTLETYRNTVSGTEDIAPADLVVFDEYHYIEDVSRGSAWEESILLSHPKTCFLLLSASVANAQQFAEWIAFLKIGHPTTLVSQTERPVKIQPLIHENRKWKELEATKPNQKKSFRSELPLDLLAIRLFEQRKLAPMLAYVSRRRSCLELFRNFSNLYKREKRSAKPKPERRAFLEQLGVYQNWHLYDRKLVDSIERYGLAFHHSGLNPVARSMVEKLLKAGLIEICCATMGLSVGINFSVKSVALGDETRPGEAGLTAYSNAEILQMVGRAGRRGMDSKGYCLLADQRLANLFLRAKRDVIHSKMKSSPSILLSLFSRGYNFRKILNIYRQSFLNIPDIEKNDFLKEEITGYATRIQCKSHTAKLKIAADFMENLVNHLKKIDCLTPQNTTTERGEIVKFLPQFGGFFLADKILEDKDFFTSGSFLYYVGAFSQASFKKPSSRFIEGAEIFIRNKVVKEEFKNSRKVVAKLKNTYPEALFPEYYDDQDIREFNPYMGLILTYWVESGCSWAELSRFVCSDRYGQGDLVNLLSRASSLILSTKLVPSAAPWKKLLDTTYDLVLRDEIQEMI